MTDPALTADPAEVQHAAPALWLIRLAALLGLLITGYLLVLAARGGVPLGCGESSGCADVLASRWSKVWRFPVSVPAMVAYLVVLAASLHAGPARPASQRHGSALIITTVAVAAGGAALWFIGLQLFVLKHVCVFCMAAHGCSLIILAAALWRGPRLLPMAGLAGTAALIATQVFLPPPASQLGPGGITGLDPHTTPTLGPPDAPHVVGLLYDYNCYYCLLTHEHLQAARERYGDRVVIVLLPTAIDPACNQHVTTASHTSLSSCAIAKLALAVWIADPGKLEAFDAYLIEQVPRQKRDGTVPPEVVDSLFRDEAARLVGGEALDAALADPRIDTRLRQAADVYRMAGVVTGVPPGVPRVVLNGRVYGSFESPAQLFDAIEAAYPTLKPADQNR